MNLHCLAFVSLFLLFANLTFRRSSWGIPLYMLTYYMSPAVVWWGHPLHSMGTRWTLVASLIFAVAVIFDQRNEDRESPISSRALLLLMLVYAINASIVHFLFAVDPERSWVGLTELWKKFGLLILIVRSINSRLDLKVMIYSILIGAGYVGYEVVVDGSLSSSHDGRVWITIGPIAGNHATALMALTLPLGAYIVFWGKKVEKIVAIGCLAFVLETVLRCNSRGVFLGLFGGAVWLAIRARGRSRSFGILGILLGIGAAMYTMDAVDRSRTSDRLSSIAASGDKRDDSVASRIEFWRAGIVMLGDHPFGSGFEAAFESERGQSYIQHLGWGEYRSCHQGYIDIAASWGIQGLCLFLAALGLAVRYLFVSSSRTFVLGNHEAYFLGLCIEAALMVFLITSLFGSNLKTDSCIWLMGMAFAHAKISSVIVQSHASSDVTTGDFDERLGFSSQ